MNCRQFQILALYVLLINSGIAETVVEDFTSIDALDPVRTTASWNTNLGNVTLGKTKPRFGEIFSPGGFDWSLSASTFSFPEDFVFADLNNDGLGDLFYITDRDCHYFLSEPGVDLADVTPRMLPENFDDREVVITGDVDNDGDTDVFVGLSDSFASQRSYFYINNGNVTDAFSADNKWFVGVDDDRFIDAALADLNNDGYLDLVLLELGDPIYLLNNKSEDPFNPSTRGTIGIGAGTQSLRKLLVADFNKDGQVDVLVIRSNGDSALYLNNGSAEPFSASSAGQPLGNSPSLDSAALTDFNNDGFMDVVASRFGDSNYIYINGGPGSLFTQPGIFIDANASGVSQFRSTADFNSDGVSDFAYASSQTLYLALNDNVGSSFSITEIGGLNSTSEHKAIDYNGDAVPDVMYSTSSDPDGMRVHLNTLSENPYSTTGMPLQFGASAGLTNNLVVFDVDNDGDNDIAVAQNGHNVLFLNNGVPLLTTGVPITSDQDNTRKLAAADLNDDAFADLVAANHGLNRWYPNDLGDGPFQRASAGVAIGSESVTTEAVATGDLNGDGVVDIVFGNVGQNHVYYGTSVENPFDATSEAISLGSLALDTRGLVVADLDNDGDLDIASANDGINYWYANDGSAQPFNADTVALALGTDDSRSNDIAAADVDLDGLSDIVVANLGFNRWYRNTGEASVFDAAADGTQLGVQAVDSRALVVNEIANNGTEIAVANAGSATAHLYRLLQPGDQVDAAEISLQDVNTASSSIASGDINGDGAADLVLGNVLAFDQIILGTDQSVSLASNAGFNLFANKVQSIALPEVTEVVQTVAVQPEDVVPTDTSIEYFVGTGPDRMQRIFPGLVLTLETPSTEFYWRAVFSSRSAAVSPVIERLTFFINPLDSDADQVADFSDNCTVIANLSQIDTDADGFGNACDTDLNNDGITNFADVEIFKQVFFTGTAAADFNDDGAVNFDDLNIMKIMFFQPPGPAGEL